MAQPVAPISTPTDRELLETVLELVADLAARFGAVEAMLDKYRPLLEMADQRMNRPRFFGGASRGAENPNR